MTDTPETEPQDGSETKTASTRRMSLQELKEKSPAELVEAAIAAGLDIVALTDHDSTAGWDEARRAVVGSSLTVLPGMEFSTRQEWRSVHVLAYLVDPEDAALLRETTRIRNDRVTRAERIVERIARDYDLSWDDVLEHSAAGATIGRPHIADALVARGHVVDRTEAFGGIDQPLRVAFEIIRLLRCQGRRRGWIGFLILRVGSLVVIGGRHQAR